MKHTLALLTTTIIEVDGPEGVREGGMMEMPVIVDDLQLRKSGDPKAFLFREIAIHLAQAINDTGIPREYWGASFTELARQRFDLPERVQF